MTPTDQRRALIDSMNEDSFLTFIVAKATIRQLLADLEAAEVYARRYRWLRGKYNSEQLGIHDDRPDADGGPFWLIGDEADAAIDAAMASHIKAAGREG